MAVFLEFVPFAFIDIAVVIYMLFFILLLQHGDGHVSFKASFRQINPDGHPFFIYIAGNRHRPSRPQLNHFFRALVCFTVHRYAAFYRKGGYIRKSSLKNHKERQKPDQKRPFHFHLPFKKHLQTQNSNICYEIWSMTVFFRPPPLRGPPEPRMGSGSFFRTYCIFQKSHIRN